MPKLPWFKFHPDHWLADERLRACSSCARGLWIDLLCLMHKSDRRGYLQLNGKPFTLEQIARSTGRSTEEVSRQMQELESAGVYSATEHGIVYSRRMVKDENKSSKCSAAGKAGGGNPTFKGQPKGTPKVAPKDKKEEERRKTTRGVPLVETPFPPSLDNPEFRSAWLDWLAFRRETNRSIPKPFSIRSQFAELESWGCERAIQSIRNSIRNNYSGLFEPKANPPPSNGFFSGLQDFAKGGAPHDP